MSCAKEQAASYTRYEELVLDGLLVAPATVNGFVPFGSHAWAKRYHVCSKSLRQAVLSLEEKGLVETHMRGRAVIGAKLTEDGRRSAVGANTRKPIMSQPSGTGKLYTKNGAGFYEGTYQMPNGKMNRKRFFAEDTRQAKSLYADWCRELEDEIETEMRERVKPKRADKQTEVSEKDAMRDADPKIETTDRKEEEMGTASEETGKVYVVQVVGGPAIAWTETFDKAAAVCDALTEAAKASGFAARYDVVDIKKWTA